MWRPPDSSAATGRAEGQGHGEDTGKAGTSSVAGHPDLEIVSADVLERDLLDRAVGGCQAIYYLIHSMNDAGRDYADQDRRAAHHMVEAAGKGGVARIIYLGGLGGEAAALSPHLRSRHEVAQILQSGSVPVTYIRPG